MKVIEILNFNRELLKKLHEAGIRLEDKQYIDLYSDGLLKRFQSDCTSGAV